MKLINIRNSIQLSFDTFGEEHNPLVLLIPGAGAPANFWPDDFCRDIATTEKFVVRFSHRDTGNSTHLDEQYSIDELLQDMVAFVDEFANTVVHLVGHSMGGYLAQMAMCTFPGKFASVTSISAGSVVSPEIASELGMSSVSQETWQTLMTNQPEGNFEQDLPGWLESWRFLNGTRPFDESMAIGYTRRLYTGDPRNAQVAVNHIHAMSTVPNTLPEQLRNSQCPFLVIHGTEDLLVPLDNGEASARLVPNSNIIRLEGAGHMFFDRALWDEISTCIVFHTNNHT